MQPPEGFEGGAYTGAGPMINSANDEISLNGLDKATAIATITEWLVEHGHGEATTTYKLRDWLFSRQRYWGEPFPILYDENDLPVAVPDSMLPVLLPEVDDYSPKTFADDDADSAPEPPLSRATEWTTVELDLGDGPKKYRRETNTMPNWAGSCWYYLRYLDPGDDEQMVDPELEKYWLGPREPGDVGGVDLYVGGVEHAVLHLLYARFWHKVLFDLGYVSSEEPFRRLVNQGYISAFAYTDERGFYVPAAEVVEKDGQFFYEGKPVNREYGKIGKSLKNMVTPDEMIGAYGADTFRVYEMSTGPLDQSRPWETKAVVGSQRLLQRIWRVVVDEQTGAVRAADVEPAEDTLRALHRTIAGVRDGLATLRFNIAIARITELTNHLTSVYGADTPVPRSVVEPLVLLVAPLAPHIAEEMWARLGHDGSSAWHPFPVADERWLVDDTVQVAVQVNGKVRSQVSVPADADAAALEAAARGRREDRRLPGRRDRAPRRRRPRPAGQLRPRLSPCSSRTEARRFGTKPSGGADADDLVAVGVATGQPLHHPGRDVAQLEPEAVGPAQGGERAGPLRVGDEPGDAVDRPALRRGRGRSHGASVTRGRVPEPLHLAGVGAGPDDERVAVRRGPDRGADRHAGAPEGREADVGGGGERGHPAVAGSNARTRASRPRPASIASATGTSRPSSADSDVTPASGMPHGIMLPNAVMSGSQLSAKPCIVTPRATRTPIAATLRSGRTRRRLVGGHPHAAAALDPAGGQPEAGADLDQRLLEPADVGDDVDRVGQRDDRVADQLTRARAR